MLQHVDLGYRYPNCFAIEIRMEEMELPLAPFPIWDSASKFPIDLTQHIGAQAEHEPTPIWAHVILSQQVRKTTPHNIVHAVWNRREYTTLCGLY